jgi:phosphoserine phosphatase RsbU/P
VGTDGRVRSHNTRFAQVWGFDDALVARGDDDALLDRAMELVAEPEAFIARVRALYDNPVEAVREDVALRDGRSLDRQGAPLHTEDGRYLGWAWTFRDVTVERRQQEEIAASGARAAALARILQGSLLPPRLPEPDGIDLAARYLPAFEGVEVGGDFYDVFAVAGGWFLVLGDVCGKGPLAAQLTGLVRWTIRAAAMHDDDPAAVLGELNAVMLADAGSREEPDAEARFATVCCLRVVRRDAGLHVDVASAGHPPPLVRRSDGSVERLATAGLPVGLFDDLGVLGTGVDLAEGDGVVVLTDGVLEARGPDGAQMEEAGVVGVLEALPGATAEAVVAAIADRALALGDGVAQDDIAVLSVVARR